MFLCFLILGLLALLFLFLRKMLHSPGELLLGALLIGAALAIRWVCLPHATLDYQDFLAKWVQFFRDYGGFAALGQPLGNYNVPYLYFLALFSYLPVNDLFLIKFLSIFFDFLLAAAGLLLVTVFDKGRIRPLVTFFLLLFLPTVVLNGAYWGQCDSIYAALSLLSLWCFFTDRPVWSMVTIALSFAFKLQAIFMMPVYFVLLYTKRLKWYHLPVFPLTYVLAVLPAVLAGRPFLDTITLYFNQMGSIGNGLNYNSPSIYAFFWRVDTQSIALASKLGILTAFALVLVLFAVTFLRRRQLDDRSLLTLALLFALGVPYLLPHMHDRYFFVSDVLSVVLAMIWPKLFPVPVLVSFGSLLGYHAYLKMRYLLTMDFGAIALAVALVLLCIHLARQLLAPGPENTPPDSP